MTESPVFNNDHAAPQESWEFYYLRKRQTAEVTLRKFVTESTSDLSENAKLAVEHGIIYTKGKRVRPVLTSLVHDLVEGSFPQISDAAILAELPHRGSLLEDDIDDHARQRDGQIPAHLLFGEPATREACDFLYNAPILILESMPIDDQKQNDLKKKYLRLAQRARVGQNKDILWSMGDTIPSIEEYLLMCEEKCAAFEFAIEAGATFWRCNR